MASLDVPPLASAARLRASSSASGAGELGAMQSAQNFFIHRREFARQSFASEVTICGAQSVTAHLLAKGGIGDKLGDRGCQHFRLLRVDGQRELAQADDFVGAAQSRG